MTGSGSSTQKFKSKSTDSWIPSILIVLILLAAFLIWYTFVNINRIREALATEVLEQQHDVEALISGYDDVLLAVQREQLTPNEGNRVRLLEELDEAQTQLDLMRSNYSFERLDGAAKAHAYVKPILEDVDQWVANGLDGFSSTDKDVLNIVNRRLQERLSALDEISNETHQVASILIDEQEEDLALFRNWLLILLLAFLALSSCFIYLLLRQRKLQHQLVRDQQQSVIRFREFASIGADWFWETGPSAKLVTDTNFLDLDAASETNPRKTLASDAVANTTSLSQKLLPLTHMRDQKPIVNHECSVELSSGSIRDFSISAKPLFTIEGKFNGYLGIGRDITRRKQIERELELASAELVQAEMRGREKAEDAMQASEQFLRTTIDSLPQRIIILDSNGRIVETNRSLEEFNRSDRTDADTSWVGKDFRAFLATRPKIKPSDNSSITSSESLSSRLREVATEGTGPISLEFSTGESNSQRWYVLRAQQLKTNESNYALLFYEDVTSSRILEEQDRRLRADLAHASRLTTVGEMASGLAHELNQPLTAISHNCDAITLLLANQKNESQDVESVLGEAVSDIATQTQRAGDIIRSMRQMIRKDSSGFEAVDLRWLLEETLRLTRPEAKENDVEVTLELADNLPAVQINPVQVQQVLVNLERNGVESMVASQTVEREIIIFAGRQDNDFAIVSVTDSGPGFDTNIANNLFTSFLTTKTDGMGLGLSISRSIVEAHGGRIWLDTSGDKTCISFTLPFVKEPDDD